MTIKDPNTKLRRPDDGFTLVEMLTVIVIIGILAAFTAYGSIAARNTVRRSIITGDLKQLEMSLQEYKTKVGELPPDFAFCDLAPPDPRGLAARARVVRHLRLAFPRMVLPGSNDEQKFAAFLTAVNGTVGPGKDQLNPSTALTFWLGGIPDSDGKPSGFHEDTTNPFKLGKPRTKPFYECKLERLDGLHLLQPNIRPASPYVYFRAVLNNTTGLYEYGAADQAGLFTPYKYSVSNDNYCVPYLEDAYDPNPTIPVDATDPTTRLRVWRAPDTYQIIAAGLDGVFSANTPVPPSPTTPPGPPYDFRFSKVGENFSDGDFDNLTSFTKGELGKEL